MKKIPKSAELLWVLGILFVAFGVAICSKSDLGVSMIAAPAFVVSEAMLPLSGLFTVGVTEYLMQGLFLLLLIFAVRRFRVKYILAFLTAVLYGYILNFFLFLLDGVSFDGFFVRLLALLAGDTLTAFGVACFFRTYLPLQVHELFVAEVVDRFGISLSRFKTVFDLSLLGISVVLALVLFRDISGFDLRTLTEGSYHSIGLGTLITTAINAPLILLLGKLIDRIFDKEARFEWLRDQLKG